MNPGACMYGWTKQTLRLMWRRAWIMQILIGSHGTRCAGEVAAARDNEVCGVGVAYDSKIAGNVSKCGAVESDDKCLNVYWCATAVCCRHPHAWPTLHDWLDRGQLHGTWAQLDWHLQRLVGTHWRRQNRWRAQECNNEGHCPRRQWGQNFNITLSVLELWADILSHNLRNSKCDFTIIKFKKKKTPLSYHSI